VNSLYVSLILYAHFSVSIKVNEVDCFYPCESFSLSTYI